MFLCLLALFAVSQAAIAEENVPSGAAVVVIEGELLEKGTKRPISDANVFILPAKVKATTDAAGRFRAEGVPAGEFRFVVNVAEYERFEQLDSQTSESVSMPRRLYLERVSYQVYETTVYGKELKRDDSTRSLKASVATKLPGSNGDPVKAVQNLPGVSRAAGFSSQVIIQGSAPEDTRYTVDGHEVPNIFHFGGFSSVMLPESLERIDYLSAGYGVEFGRAMGGLVGVWSKKPDRERLKGFVYADLINAGAAIETPVGERGSLIMGVRRSYIGNVLKAVMKEEEDDAVNLTAAPAFQDFTLVYDRPITGKDDFRFVFLGSQDTLKFVFTEPPENDPEIRGDFETKIAFISMIPQWTRRHSQRTTSRWSLGVGQDWTKFILDDQFFRIKVSSFTQRFEVERSWSDSWTSFFGLDNRLAWAHVSLNLPDFYNPGGVANPVSTGKQQRVDVRATSHNLGGYWNNDVRLDDRWSLKAGLRYDYFASIREGNAGPRAALKRNFSPYRSLRVASGIYYQPPSEQQTSEEVGNPDLRAPRALHLAMTFEEDFRRGASNGWIVQGGPFARRFDHLVIPSSAIVTRGGVASPEYFNNEGDGRAYGFEMLVRYEAAPWNAWLSYTVSRSTRKQPGQPWYPAEFDQTQNVNLIVGRDLPRNWRVSGRFRFVTGNPLTPVVGAVFDADNDAYVPVRGPFFSERVKSFYQLDLRADKKWIYERMILTAYLDIQNATNRQNVESVSYAYDYSTRTDVTGLPIIPSIGLKGEF